MSALPPRTATLTGQYMVLVPLTADHPDDLFEAGGGDEEVRRRQGGPAPPRPREERLTRLDGVPADAEELGVGRVQLKTGHRNEPPVRHRPAHRPPGRGRPGPAVQRRGYGRARCRDGRSSAA
ncbi:hypothetical protein ABZ154_32955 [Streptomyces sp. NPDC006261]|uniref:hypothetical protein n=1 Tax=Streptomyces sp. NPDC006261 TaxID=3156739 RepID=UPI0033B865F8